MIAAIERCALSRNWWRVRVLRIYVYWWRRVQLPFLFFINSCQHGGQLGERRQKGEDSCHHSNHYWGFTYRVWHRRSTGFRRIAWWMDRLCLFRRLDWRVGKQKFSFCMNKPATSLALSQWNWSFNQRCPGFWKVHYTSSLKCTRKKVLHTGVCWEICLKNNIPTHQWTQSVTIPHKNNFKAFSQVHQTINQWSLFFFFFPV